MRLLRETFRFIFPVTVLQAQRGLIEVLRFDQA